LQGFFICLLTLIVKFIKLKLTKGKEINIALADIVSILQIRNKKTIRNLIY